MGIFINKKSFLKRRLRSVEKELTSIDRSISKGTGCQEGIQVSRLEDPEHGAQAIGSETIKPHDERFVDYFSTSFQPIRPLKHEKKTQRNKAIVMSVFVFFVLLWVICRLLSV